ncbi:MAG: polyprenyl synthetase family protein, partial [Anaerolineae bacterium]|nr:polyprenyl synthetase family protein [Anaerolineae bacterium]
PARFSAEQILAVSKIINRACIDLTKGQDLDIRFESLPEVNTEMYLDMVYKKTGALVEAAIVAGATLGTSDPTIIKNYYNFARNIGIAFQVQDDILGIWGDSAQTGKSADNDLYRRKKTLPIIYMLDKTTGARRERLQAIYAQPDPPLEADLTLVRDSLAESEARAYTQTVAQMYRARAFEALHRVGLQNQAQSELEAVANFLIDRSY